MPLATIPLTGAYTNRNADPINAMSKDQRFINCFPEVVESPVLGTKVAYLNKRPGVNTSTALTGVSVGGLASCYWSGKSQPCLSYINTGLTSTSIWETTSGTKIGGNIANTNQCVALSETSINGTANLTGYFADSAGGALEAWYYPDGGAWTQITDADFPANLGTPDPIVGGPVHMDGYMFVLTQGGKIYHSNINSLSAWDASNYITADTYPDLGIDLAKYRNMIVAFGTRSIEFFRNAGNAVGSVLSRMQDASIGIGVPSLISTSRRKIIELGGTVYFIGTSPETGRNAIYYLDGLSPVEISSSPVDRLLFGTIEGISGIVGAFALYGETHIAFSTYDSESDSTAPRICYATKSKQWWQHLDGRGRIMAAATGHRGVGAFSNDSAKYDLIGNIAVNYQDDTTDYTMTIQTEQHVLNKGRAFHINSIELIADNQASGNTGIAVSGDDYATFTTARNFDMTQTRKKLWRFGRFRNHAIFKLTHTANTAWRGQVLLVDWEPAST